MMLSLSFGCRKDPVPMPDCGAKQGGATIIRIAGPDSIRAGTSEAITLELIAPDRCVSDIAVSVERIDDTTYIMEPLVTYYTRQEAGCSCSVAPRHYVRVYFSPPVAGIVSINTGTGIGYGPAYKLRVY